MEKLSKFTTKQLDELYHNNESVDPDVHIIKSKFCAFTEDDSACYDVYFSYSDIDDLDESFYVYVELDGDGGYILTE